MEELEDELQATEDQKMRLEVNMQALKTQYERDLQAKEEAGEEKRRGMTKQLRDLEVNLTFLILFYNPNPISSILIHFDQVWSSLIKFDPIWSILIKFDPFWSNLIKLDPFWTGSIRFDQVSFILIKLDPFWSLLIYFGHIWSNLTNNNDHFYPQAELDEERKQKTAALNSKKKLEGDLKDLESTMDMNNKMKEDAIKQLKKHQAALKELTRDADEAHLAKAEAIQQYKEFEKKFWDIIKNVKFHNRPNEFQNMMKRDLNQLKQMDKIVVFADKSNNLYCVSKNEYLNEIKNNITTEYKRSTSMKVDEVNKKAAIIAIQPIPAKDHERTASAESNPLPLNSVYSPSCFVAMCHAPPLIWTNAKNAWPLITSSRLSMVRKSNWCP